MRVAVRARGLLKGRRSAIGLSSCGRVRLSARADRLAELFREGVERERLRAALGVAAAARRDGSVRAFPGRRRRRRSAPSASSASRTLKPSFSLRSSSSARTPAATSASRTRRAVVAAARSVIGRDDDLDGREPEREVAARVLDVERDEALERAEDRAVEHRGLVLAAVAADVAQAEAARASPCPTGSSRASRSGRARRRSRHSTFGA